MKVIYIVAKFRGPDAWAVEENIRKAERVGFDVACYGMSPLIPHTNTRFFNGTLTEQFWLDATMALLRKCDAVITHPNWTDSEGGKAEVKEALRLGIPVFYEITSLVDWLHFQQALAEAK